MEFRILDKTIRRNPVDIEFRNVCYKIGKKEILKSVSGKFCSGQLTAILGCSGAGKSSLMSVLAGHIQKEIEGDILINGRPRDMKTFRKTSCYLMQEDSLRSFVSVREMINMTARLKLGQHFSPKEKEVAVEEVINIMDLKECSETKIKYLSGGQKKRLSVALEMINNPLVFFIDEPCTGLDNVLATKFIQFLKRLVARGRTIICTIHQPSDLMFQLFDHVYFMTDGYCVYNGDVKGIIPFLGGVNLPCPSTYSPCDYILELVHFNEENVHVLTKAISNGKKCNLINSNSAKIEISNSQNLPSEFDNTTDDFPSSFLEQFSVLSSLMLMEMKRDRTLLLMQYAAHLFATINIGLIYQNIGNNGARMVTNFLFFFCTVVYQSFVYMMPLFLLFPFEIKLLQKEYLNRWYSLKAYFSALSVVTLIPTVIPATATGVILYFMSNQPFELDRILEFVLISILTALVCQGYGHNIGSFCTPKAGAIVGSCFGLSALTFSIYNMGYTDIASPFIKFLMSLSYARHSLTGYAIATMKDREVFDCEEFFCYFRDPKVGLRMFGMDHDEYYVQIIYLLVFIVISKFLTYFFLRLRVTPNSKLFRL